MNKEAKELNVFVDIVIFSVIQNKLHVLTQKRANQPFKDKWALIGGYIDIEKDKTIEDAAKRTLRRKTGVNAIYLEQYCSIGNSSRDPRGWSITIVYFALVHDKKSLANQLKSKVNLRWLDITEKDQYKSLAFDHKEILTGCIKRLKSKTTYSSLPVFLLDGEFSIRELQTIYEVILDKKLEHKSFRRRILNSNILEPTNKVKITSGRPSATYRTKNSENYIFTRSLENINL